MKNEYLKDHFISEFIVKGNKLILNLEYTSTNFMWVDCLTNALPPANFMLVVKILDYEAYQAN